MVADAVCDTILEGQWWGDVAKQTEVRHRHDVGRARGHDTLLDKRARAKAALLADVDRLLADDPERTPRDIAKALLPTHGRQYADPDDKRKAINALAARIRRALS